VTSIEPSVGYGDDIVVQLSVGQSRFWVTEANENMKRFSPNVMGATTGRTLLVLDDPEQPVKSAVDAGAIETSSVTDEHGWRLGRIVDLFGHEWEIGRPLGSWPPESNP
jgi:PhnB protein